MPGTLDRFYVAKFKLSTIVNNSELIYSQLEGKMRIINNLPEIDSLILLLENNPLLKRFETEFDRNEAVSVYEEANAIPDLTITAGIKRLADVNANTFLLGASIPLPIFNRNQGSIQEAKINLDKKKIEYQIVKNSLTLKLNLFYNRIKTLLDASTKLKNESIPNAEDTYRIIREGNQVGRFKILDVLDAERTLLEVQNAVPYGII